MRALFQPKSNKAPLLNVHIYIDIYIYLDIYIYKDIYIYLYSFHIHLQAMTREDSLQNQVSCGSLNLQVNLVSGLLNHRKTQGNVSFAFVIKYKTGTENNHFIHNKNAIKLNYRGDKSSVNLSPLQQTSNKITF